MGGVPSNGDCTEDLAFWPFQLRTRLSEEEKSSISALEAYVCLFGLRLGLEPLSHSCVWPLKRSLSFSDKPGPQEELNSGSTGSTGSTRLKRAGCCRPPRNLCILFAKPPKAFSCGLFFLSVCSLFKLLGPLNLFVCKLSMELCNWHQLGVQPHLW